jgi:hypothetical protein
LVLKAHRLALLRAMFAMETRKIGPESTPLRICGQSFAIETREIIIIICE